MQVVSVTSVNGGTAFNVIPDSATLAGTYRAFSRKSFHALRDRIEEVTADHTYLTSMTWLSSSEFKNNEDCYKLISEEIIYFLSISSLDSIFMKND